MTLDWFPCRRPYRLVHIKKEGIGTHLIRLGAAMAMFLGNCLVCLIMMIGCWSSDAFLWYIIKQVKQFSHNVSKRMTKQMFHRHIPMYTTLSVSHLDPRQRNNPNNAKIKRNVGGDMTQQARLPPFALYNEANHVVQFVGHNYCNHYILQNLLRRT